VTLLFFIYRVRRVVIDHAASDATLRDTLSEICVKKKACYRYAIKLSQATLESLNEC